MLLWGLAAAPCLMLVSQAVPLQPQARNANDVIFAQGGPQLDDIVLKSTIMPRSELASIFAQSLIVTRKLNPKWITSYFKGYDGEEKLSGDTCEVKPYWMDYREVEEKESISVAGCKDSRMPISYKSMECASDMSSQHHGWGKKGEDTLMGVDLAKQSLELITGYRAMSTGPTDEALLSLRDADSTPFLLHIGSFDHSKPDLKHLRWESWVSVMSYDPVSKELHCGTSYYDGGDGITQKINIEELGIFDIVSLLNKDKFENERAPKL